MKAWIAVLTVSTLAACKPAAAPEDAQQGVLAPHDRRIECALGGSDRFERACTVERTASKAGPVLTISGPDGGFRRLLVTTDGVGVVAADGAEPALVTPLGPDRIEVRLGRDRYRLPATVRGQAP